MRTLGRSGPVVSDIGLGCMGMSDLYGPADDRESIATIQAALDAGLTLLDTGDYYGMGHNELLIRDALQGRNRDQVVISVKCGAMRDPKGNWLGIDGRPAAVKNFLAYTLRRLGTGWVDIYRLGRVELRRVAEPKGATVAHVAIAWVLSRGADVVPLVGARRRERLAEALGAMTLTLTADDLEHIERAVPVGAAAGERYAAAQMATLDSEAQSR